MSFVIEGQIKIVYHPEENLITRLAIIDFRTNPAKDIYA